VRWAGGGADLTGSPPGAVPRVRATQEAQQLAPINQSGPDGRFKAPESSKAQQPRRGPEARGSKHS